MFLNNDNDLWMYHIGPHEIDIIICINEHEPIKDKKKLKENWDKQKIQKGK